MADKQVTKYLDKYCEAETTLLKEFALPSEFRNGFNHAVVIPAYNETHEFVDRWLKQFDKHALLIVVINEPDLEQGHDHSSTINKTLFDYLTKSGDIVWRKGKLVLVMRQGRAILIVDRFSQASNRIPRKQGVGLARKIGLDIAVTLWANEQILSEVIHTTDADANLPEDYFLQTTQQPLSAAYVYRFSHRGPDNPTTRATRLYEQSIQYYVDGLNFAGSPYAFHTIGSCLAISARHYCQVRGFPKKNGGEDFYLLNKLAKLAPIKSLSGSPIYIDSRLSNRAPFGTGPSVEKILGLKEPNDFGCYDPVIFVELQTLLRSFSELANADSANQFHLWRSALSEANQRMVDQLSFIDLWQHLNKQQHRGSNALKHIHCWFDAFRTLKYVHELQRHVYPPLPCQLAFEKFATLAHR
ncbi:hypothetical protein [Aurantivibrio plasticivorans]